VLAQLVSLLKEFYAATDNSRKKEIGEVSVQLVKSSPCVIICQCWKCLNTV